MALALAGVAGGVLAMAGQNRILMAAMGATVALDLVLFSDLAQRAGLGGIQEWLSFYYKSPQVAPGLYPEHDLFVQLTKLKNTLRWMMNEDQITHLGREYYDGEDD